MPPTNFTATKGCNYRCGSIYMLLLFVCDKSFTVTASCISPESQMQSQSLDSLRLPRRLGYSILCVQVSSVACDQDCPERL